MESVTKKLSGGLRPGSGRKEGTGKFKEPTDVIRVPASQKPAIIDFLAEYRRNKLANKSADEPVFEYPTKSSKKLFRPLFSSKVPAGFPSPADDHIEAELDINDYLVDQPEATFYNTVEGNSMIDVGLFPGDKAVVNRAKEARVGDIILAVLDGEFTIKRLGKTRSGRPILFPENAAAGLKPIRIGDESSFDIWGVVVGSFRRFK